MKRGEEIAVYARGGGIQVRTVARARQDGARGELIGVESLEAKEPFDAVVTGIARSRGVLRQPGARAGESGPSGRSANCGQK